MDSNDEQTPNSDIVTEDVRVQAAAHYLADQSEPDRGPHLYAYRVRITNEGDERVQLLSRHWIVLDAHNRRDDVRGEGVVGKRPMLAPGEIFEYTSSCPLRTRWGTMEGSYTFRREDGTHFEVAIGRFFLVPGVDNAAVVGV